MATDVAQPLVEQGPGAAVSAARRRVEDIRLSVGRRHPDYAPALVQLALSVMMDGDPTEAEQLLQEATDVRRDTLGDRHPDYATCLSSLAGLLWARGDLDGAEPLLRKALLIRCDAFGERHPKTMVSQKGLDQLLTAKRAESAAEAQNGAAHADSLAPAAPEPINESGTASPSIDESGTASPSAEAAMAASTSDLDGNPVFETQAPAAPESHDPLRQEDLVRQLHELGAAFAVLGDQLAQVAVPVREGGPFPADTLVDDLRAANERFNALRAEVRAQAESVGVADAAERRLDDLEGCAALLEEAGRLETERASQDSVRRKAFSIVERVLRLSHSERSDFTPLLDCQAAARELACRISAAQPLPEVVELADGSHPLAALLVLAGVEVASSDDAWADAQAQVETHLGRPLAIAASRFKIVLQPTPDA